MPQPVTAPANKDAAYLHMASFPRGQIATITGQGQAVTGEVTVPQQHRDTDIGAAWMTIRSEGDTCVTVTVNQMIDGRWLLATADDADDADRGHWQPFDPVGYRFFTEPGAFPDPDLAGYWLAGRRDAADRPGEWFPPRPARCTDEQYWAYSEGWAQAAEPSEDTADFVAAHREAYPNLIRFGTGQCGASTAVGS